MVKTYDLHRLIESWITVSTVFLAVEFGVLTLIITGFPYGEFGTPIPYYLGVTMIICNVMSLATFLGGRDPRQEKFNTQLVLDVGVSMLAASLFFAALSGSFIIYDTTNDLVLAIFSGMGLIIAMVIYFPILYFKYLHKKNI